MITASPLFNGLLFSVALGAPVVWLFWLLVGWFSDLPLKKDLKRSMSNQITGSVERTFFTIVVAYKMGDPIAGMMAWTAIKLAAGSRSAKHGGGESWLNLLAPPAR